MSQIDVKITPKTAENSPGFDAKLEGADVEKLTKLLIPGIIPQSLSGKVSTRQATDEEKEWILNNYDRLFLQKDGIRYASAYCNKTDSVITIGIVYPGYTSDETNGISLDGLTQWDLTYDLTDNTVVVYVLDL